MPSHSRRGGELGQCGAWKAEGSVFHGGHSTGTGLEQERNGKERGLGGGEGVMGGGAEL